MNTKRSNTIFGLVSSVMVVGVTVMFLHLFAVVTRAVELYGAMSSISLSSAIATLFVLLFVVIVSILITAALAYRAPHLGDSQKRDTFSSLEESAESINHSTKM